MATHNGFIKCMRYNAFNFSIYPIYPIDQAIQAIGITRLNLRCKPITHPKGFKTLSNDTINNIYRYCLLSKLCLYTFIDYKL